jgi:hypothetical protein
MGFGLSGFGTTFFGDGPATIGLSGARAVGTHLVEVTLTEEPRAHSGFDEGDVFNPNTWAVQNEDTLEWLPVLAVGRVDHLTYLLQLGKPLASWHTSHAVETSSLRSALGALVSEEASNWLFPGVLDQELADPVAQANSRRYPPRDLANPQNSGESGALGGSLQVGADGDYATEEGDALLRKLIIRRLVTPRGGFFHLPDYGAGITLKEPVYGSSPAQLAREVERQVQQEPEVEACRASVTVANNVLTLMLRVRLRQGGQLDIGLRDEGSGVLEF